MRIALVVMVMAAVACDPIFRYRVIARNASGLGAPVPGGRLSVSCSDDLNPPVAITDRDGRAEYLGLGFGLPAWCRLELRHRAFLDSSVDVASICKVRVIGPKGQCRSAEWKADLQPLPGAAVVPSSAAAPAATWEGQGPAERLGFLFGVGELWWQRCGTSALLSVPKGGSRSKTGALFTAAAEHVEVRSLFIALDASYVTVLLESAEQETLLLVRIEDAGALSLAWHRGPEPRGSLSYALKDLDGDGEPELRVRARGEEPVSFKRGVGGAYERWDRPAAGGLEGASAEVCRWFEEKTGNERCDSVLDLDSQARTLAAGSKIVLVRSLNEWWRTNAPSAAFLLASNGTVRLLISSPGGVWFDDRAHECFWHHKAFAFFDDREKLCVRDGTIVEVD